MLEPHILVERHGSLRPGGLSVGWAERRHTGERRGARPVELHRRRWGRRGNISRRDESVAGTSRADLGSGGCTARLLGPAAAVAGRLRIVAAPRAATHSGSSRPLRRTGRRRAAFFWLQRSGVAIDDGRGSRLRPSGRARRRAAQPRRHGGAGVARARTPSGSIRAGAAGTFDVSGGWYDAGDYGKYVTSGAHGGLAAAGHRLDLLDARSGPARSTSLAALLDECRWQLDWLLRMQVPAGRPWPGWPSTGCTARSGRRCPAGRTRIRRRRVLHRPSTGGHPAARGGRRPRRPAVRAVDPAYAERLLGAAATAYAAATSIRS